jgi:zinc protease
MHRLASIALALLLGVVPTACAGRPATRADASRSTTTRHVLPNGVRVVVEPRPTANVVAVQLWVGAGGRDESPAEHGFAHLLEHMLFQGTERRPSPVVGPAVEGLGGRMNATTSVDYTYYQLTVPPAHAATAVDFLADIAVNAVLDDAVLEREKRVVLGEMRLAEDSTPRLLMRKLYEALFPSHVYGRPVIGTADVIRGVTRGELLAFYRRHYAPGSFTMVVVGPVRREEVVEVATAAFGRLPRGGGQRLPASPPSGLPERLDVSRPGTSTHLAMGWPAARLDQADTPAVEVLVAILGRMPSSRLTTALRDRRGLVTSVSAGYAAMEAVGAVWIVAQLESADVASTEAAIVHEISRLRDLEVDERERARAVAVAEAQRQFEGEAVETRAFALGHAETVWRLSEERAYLDRLRGVTRDQVQAAARRYLDPGRYARVVLRPQATSR